MRAMCRVQIVRHAHEAVPLPCPSPRIEHTLTQTHNTVCTNTPCRKYVVVTVLYQSEHKKPFSFHSPFVPFPHPHRRHRANFRYRRSRVCVSVFCRLFFISFFMRVPQTRTAYFVCDFTTSPRYYGADTRNETEIYTKTADAETPQIHMHIVRKLCCGLHGCGAFVVVVEVRTWNHPGSR